MDNSTLIKAAIAVTILLLITVLVLSFYTKKQSRNTVLLLGICDAGKTSLYTLVKKKSICPSIPLICMQLRFGEKRSTVSSMKENEGQLAISNKTFDVVDLPGHERVRYRYVDFLPVAQSIVFVIDSTTLNKQVRSVAEYLYDVLAKPQVQKNRIPVLVACNKSDMITALPTEKIRLMLETEINRLRSTRTARVEQSEEDETEIFLGYEGEDFKFEHVDNELEFVSCSVENKDIEKVQDWIRN